MPHVVFKVDQKEAGALELTGPTIVGRSPECQVSIKDILLSRRHLQFLPTNDGWMAMDLGSANGTRVDGELINRHELSDGDLIELGHIKIVYLQDSLPANDSTAASKRIVIDPAVFALTPNDVPKRTVEAPPAQPGAKLSSSVTAIHYTPPEVIERAKRWEQAAAAQTVTRTQPPTLTERINKLPRGLALSAVALTGLALFAAAFFMTSTFTR